MTGELFNPDAFEQLPGQMSMAQVEPSFAADEPWRPSCGRAYCIERECCGCDVGDEPEARHER